MEGPKFEKSSNNQEEQRELLEARIKNARKVVEQVEEQLVNAKTEDERIIWENRIKQRQEDFNRI